MCSKKTAAAPSTRMDTCAREGDGVSVAARRRKRGRRSRVWGERGGVYEGGDEEGQREGARDEAGDGGEGPDGGHHRVPGGRCRVHPLLCCSRALSGPADGEICRTDGAVGWTLPARLAGFLVNLHFFAQKMALRLPLDSNI